MQNPQFAWFLGHVAVLAGTLFYFFSLITFKSNPRAYSTAYLGALVSYGVVVYKSLGVSAKGSRIQIVLFCMWRHI
jgi:hypothetical protein